MPKSISHGETSLESGKTRGERRCQGSSVRPATWGYSPSNDLCKRFVRITLGINHLVEQKPILIEEDFLRFLFAMCRDS